MNVPRRVGWIKRLAIAATLLVVVVGGVFFVSVTWQVYAYRNTATEMAAILASRHPNLKFTATVGYERTIGITVSELPDEQAQQAIQDWLGQELAKRGLHPRLHLVFR